LQLINDPGLRMVMGKGGKERVEINFREESSREELLEAYEYIFSDFKRIICEAK
jgi:hypothetical protein